MQPSALAALVGLLSDKTITVGAARQVLDKLVAEGGDPEAIVDAEGLRAMEGGDELAGIVAEAIAANADVAEKIRAAVGSHGAGRVLVALQLANNETGVLQPVAEIAAIAREAGASLFTDAAQAAGRIPVDFSALGADFMALSAHKLGGPKGIGALIVRDGHDLPAFIRGGGQERRRRGGTENIPGIAGFGEDEAGNLYVAGFGNGGLYVFDSQSSRVMFADGFED